MAHHAYYAAGDTERGIADARVYGEEALGLSSASADVLVFRYGHFSVDDARAFTEAVRRTGMEGNTRLLIIAAERLFHEAQNALLKALEEPPEGTVIVLATPSLGDLLPTVRSRLLPLPRAAGKSAVAGLAEEFAHGDSAARAKLVERILARAKKDAPEEKQAARAEALSLVEGLARLTYEKDAAAHHLLLRDLDRLIPVLHDRAAPLKPILEHLLIVTGKI